MNESLSPVVFALLSVGSAVFFLRRTREVFRRPVDAIESRLFGLPDAVLVTLLGFFLLASAASASSAPGVLSGRVIANSSLFYLCVVLGIASFLLVRGIRPDIVFGLSRRLRPGDFLSAIGWLAVAYPPIFLAQALSQRLSSDAQPQEILLFLIRSASTSDRLLVIALAVLVAPLAEEVIFRGYLQGVLRKYAGRRAGVLVSALLFAAIHAHLPSMAGLFLFGVLLSLIYERSGSLWTPIVVHSVFNGITVFVALYFPWLITGG